MFKKIMKKAIIFLWVFSFFLPIFSLANPVDDSVSISATVLSTTNNITPEEGGGVVLVYGPGTQVNFSGFAYPYGNVSILRDSQKIAETTAKINGSFYVETKNNPTGPHVFTIVGRDSDGLFSPSYSVTISILPDVVTTVDNIFLGPTISINPFTLLIFSPVFVSGQTVPYANVSVQTTWGGFATMRSEYNGRYKGYLPGSNLIGEYLSFSQANTLNLSSMKSFNLPIKFTRTKEELPVDTGECSSVPPDFNCDGRVNYIDFSILLYWYDRGEFLDRMDISHNGKIDVPDFSILAYYWTG